MKPHSLVRYLKFLPLVALLAFGVTLVSLPKSSDASPLGPPTLSTTFVPIGGTTIVSAQYSDDLPAGNAVLSGSPALGIFVAGSASVTPNNGETVTIAGATITVSDDTDTVSTTKQVVGTFQCAQAGVMNFTIVSGSASAPSTTLVCGDGSFNYGLSNPYAGFFGGFPYSQYPYSQYPYGTTTYPTVATTAMGVSVTASPASTTCTSPSTISITVKDAAGNLAANGTSVTVSASTGTVSPNVVSTSGGYATTSFVAPNNANGTATVTATSGTGTGYATVSFSCTGAAAVTVPSTITSTQPVYVPPAVSVAPLSIISPPNTGDAGLVAELLNAS